MNITANDFYFSIIEKKSFFLNCLLYSTLVILGIYQEYVFANPVLSMVNILSIYQNVSIDLSMRLNCFD